MNFDQIKFDEIRRDVIAEGISRMLSQYRKPLLEKLLASFLSEVKVLNDSIVDMMSKRTISNAEGDSLDAIGRIVGENRTYTNYNDFEYFSPDSSNISVDQGEAWCINAPLFGVSIANDAQYLESIKLKIFKNFMNYSSVDELKQITNSIIGFPVGFGITYPFDLDLFVPSSIPKNKLAILKEFNNNIRVENNYKIPYPATARVNEVYFYIPFIAFTPDQEETPPDIGMAAVKG